MSYQQVDEIANSLRKHPTLGPLRRIIKLFSQFTKLEEQLPPENLMAFSLFEIPTALNKLIGVESGEPIERDLPLKLSLQVQLYLTSLWKLLSETTEPDIQFVVLEGFSKSCHLVVGFPKIMKQWAKLLIDVWATCEIKIKVRAFNVINRLLVMLNQEDATWLLRRAYVRFVENAKHVTWRNYEYVNLMINCYCELSRSCPQTAYFVIFGYLRMIAMQIEKALKQSKTKKKQLVRKLYSFEILNCLRLLTSVVTRIDSEELSSLVYPLIQILEGYTKLNCSTEYIPLRLHIVDLLLEISQRTGVFIPYVNFLTHQQLQCKQFGKNKPKIADKAECELALLFQISQKNMKSTNFWGLLFTEIIKKFYRIANLQSRMMAAPELLGCLRRMLKEEFQAIKFSGYKIQLKILITHLKKDALTLEQMRSSVKGLCPTNKNGLVKYQTSLQQKKKLEVRKNHEQIVQDDLRLLKDKLRAELQDDQVAGEEQEQQYQQQYKKQPRERIDQEEGYVEDDQSGASSYEPSEHEQVDSDDEQKEEVDYQGDPDNIQEVIRDWSEHEWSSQNEVEP